MYWPTAYIASTGNRPEVLALIEKTIINPSALFCNSASAKSVFAVLDELVVNFITKPLKVIKIAIKTNTAIKVSVGF